MIIHCATGCDVCRRKPMPEAIRAAAVKLDADALEALWRAIGDTDRSVAEGAFALARIVRHATQQPITGSEDDIDRAYEEGTARYETRRIKR